MSNSTISYPSSIPKICGALGILILLSVGLAGCAVSALTGSDAKQFADLSLYDFLDTRFQDRQSVVVKNTVRYLAYFNDINYRQLERPTVDLSNFCQAGGGSMARTSAFSRSPVGEFFLTPSKIALKAYFHSVAKGRSDIAVDVAARSFLISEQVNEQLGQADAKKAYSAVLDKGTYGGWECTYKGSERKSWQVDIIPIIYAPPSDPGNLMTNHRMILEVTPIQE